ncbi:CRISPR-associated protein Cas4 [Acidaminococcus sp. NSJ-142]|jgi:CRISPR-associated exonuclease Cas4|uniref:CRISPR-associated protein Cas4 n=1 Tax=Acidaminococcus TaxID=904 RepID=UPI000E54D46A|nr:MULTISPECIES: CRISPR-associated protein Cas4 [Acidaminococcus]MCD2436406.1 CRISPR-associated protein Cas4 [Acidaminococcus hominis]MCH4097391.1 CRISPR-associated protein Cas4 [Acidaminococcus provencensis]RHK00987.1 CRISPR-associated protein Cas4 [Acidaminococcus sp. AM05-11]
MAYKEDEYLLLSGIQHFAFCRRQWALIHIGQVWAENRLTAEGELVHKNAHKNDYVEKRAGIMTVRALKIASPQLGISGQCDVVEFLPTEQEEIGIHLPKHRGLWQVNPVEYKRGKDKDDGSDMLQLCCEVLCLEEMLACHIDAADLFYHELMRRRRIEITDTLRLAAKNTLLEMHGYFSRGIIPKVKPSKRCSSCSLKDYCLPSLLKRSNVAEYYQDMLGDGKK